MSTQTFSHETASRLGLASGALAAIAYSAAVIVGGLVTPGYSHMRDDVSALVQRGATQKPLLDPLFYGFNVLVLVFGVAVFLLVRRTGHRRRVGLIGGSALAFAGVFGFLATAFPRDPVGDATTFAGSMHLIFVGITAPLYVVTLGSLGWWFMTNPGLRALGWYSVATLLLLCVTGPLTAILISSPIMGLFERGTGFGFAVWLLVVSLALIRRDGVGRRLRDARAVPQSGVRLDRAVHSTVPKEG
jgi:hypothetical protein